jgi:hypothetical protein
MARPTTRYMGRVVRKFHSSRMQLSFMSSSVSCPSAFPLQSFGRRRSGAFPCVCGIKILYILLEEVTLQQRLAFVNGAKDAVVLHWLLGQDAVVDHVAGAVVLTGEVEKDKRKAKRRGGRHLRLGDPTLHCKQRDDAEIR